MWLLLGQRRRDLDLGMQCAVHRAAIGDLEQPLTLSFIEGSLEHEFTTDVVDFRPALRRLGAILEHDNVKLMDINMRPPFVKQNVIEDLVRKADIAKMNDDELRTMAGWHKIQKQDLEDMIRWFGDTYGVETVCVTRGKDGAMVMDKGEIWEHPGFRVKTVDTVGAGDAFLAGFVSKLFDDRGAAEALKYACALGAYVATKAGATPKYHFNEITKLIKQ